MSFKFIPPDPKKFHDYIEKETQKIMESVVEAYQLAFMEAVNRAKMTDTYKDRTNNLRSSIGYVLYHNGTLVSEHFEASGKGTGATDVSFTTKEGVDVAFTTKKEDNSGVQGIRKGQKLAHDIAKRHNQGVVGILVAGENYALYVESNGLDVITGSSLGIVKELKASFQEINKEHGTNF